MAHNLFQIQSYLISQPKVSFQFLIFKESSYMHGVDFYIPLFYFTFGDS